LKGKHVSNLREQLRARVADALRAAQAAGELPAFDAPELTVERPKKPEWGDYSLAVMALAKPARLAPLKVAEIVARHCAAGAPFGAPSVAPPGYLNFTLDTGWLAEQIGAILAAGEAWGNVDQGHGRRAQVEFVSANPTGPLHVGRVRGAVIGDSMASVLSATGWQVEREYYFNDAGRQMDNLGESLRLRYLQALGRDVTFPEDGELYAGEYLVEMAKTLAAERGDALAGSEATVFQEIAREAMFAHIKATLQRMHVHHDVYFREQSLYETGAVEAYLALLRAAGVVYEQDGAIWLRLSAISEGEQDKVLVKASGQPTYRLPDMAYHKDKLGRGFDLVVDVLGADHKEEWKEVMAGLRAVGLPAERVRLLMHQFISFKGGRMSTRRGNIVTVDDLLDEVGPDATRYLILQRSAESHLEFDLDLAVKQSKDNPVFYVQYAHTRAASILRKAREEHGLDWAGADVSLITHPKELSFLRRALELEDVLAHAAERLEPHHLAFYAYELARALHAFYDDAECRVLPGDPPVPPELTRARLALVRAAQIVLGKVLHLMGMSAPETM
jgi:arginyl-tRNA synthetase